MKIFLTSDTHFCHDKDFLWKPRGFNSPEEMNEAIVERWNSVVGKDDIVYHLGDVMLTDNEGGMACLERLNGHIYFVRGNHDTNTRWSLYDNSEAGRQVTGYAEMIKKGKHQFLLSHYPVMVGNFQEQHGPICLHGHTHSKDRFEFWEKYRCYNVNMDAHDCYPVSLEQIIEDIKNYQKEE